MPTECPADAVCFPIVLLCLDTLNVQQKATTIVKQAIDMDREENWQDAFKVDLPDELHAMAKWTGTRAWLMID